MDIENLGQTVLLAFGLLCVLPLLTFAVLMWVVVRAGQQRLEAWLGPDVAKIQQQYADLQQRYPQASQDDLVNRIIRQQAMKCGVIGAITGIGGLVTLPIALPIDIVLSFRVQAALIEFIAVLYSGTPPGTVRNYLVMTGSSRVTQSSTNLLMRLALRVIGKSFSKLIPVVGAVVSFGVNYVIVQLMGRAAVRWYAAQSADTP
ncbi:MAG: hypothetical protein CL610_23440 [Anaerolineaceae bacterium]|nr:hypothetical protein [Anaerolineaceae bacterium]